MAKVEDGSIESFRPQRRNLNKHSQRGMGALEASMRKHGYVAPMTAAADGEIIDGSARLETVANVFEDDVLIVHHDGTKPVVMVRDDIPNASTNEARAISMLANRISEINLTWDAEELLADLQSGVDFGNVFDQEELDAMLAGLVAPKKVEDTPPDVSKADELQKKWQTQTGQMWQLGKHRLICGDCRDKATVERLMQGEVADMVFTDPPYNVDYVGKTKDKLTIDNDTTSDIAVLGVKMMASVLGDGCAIYVCFPAEQMMALGEMWESPIRLQSMIVWSKNTFVMGRKDYQYQHEPIWYGWKEGAAHRWFGGRTEATVWPIDKPSTNEEHPTIKPIELPVKAISNSSVTGDIVLDLFLGSGTTLMACEQTNRRCFASELSPAYVAVALQRFQDGTGIEPVLIS